MADICCGGIVNKVFEPCGMGEPAECREPGCVEELSGELTKLLSSSVVMG